MSNYQIKLEEFEGPLDLLLKLIEGQELDITKVSLSKVADQFITYVNQAVDLHPGEMADFLVVSSKLLLIKSKVLLPSLDIDDEEASSLEKQLKIYKEYYEASKLIRQKLREPNFMFTRSKAIRVFTPRFSPPKDLKAQMMSEIFAKALSRLEVVVNLPKKMIKKTISIKEKIRHISELILSKVSFSFKQLLSSGQGKTEVIVSFLAVLELVKQKTLEVEQEGGLFSDIMVKKIEQ